VNRAPVYRHIETETTLLGLSLNSFVFILGISFAAIQLLGTAPSLAAIGAAYTLLRVGGHGRPALYWQHWLVHRARHLWGRGRINAHARTRFVRFPFAKYQSDIGSR
jgi:hypothetical protein